LKINTQNKEVSSSLKLNIQKRTISICCTCILLAALIVGVLPYLSFPAKAAEVVSTGSCGDNLTYTLTDDGVLTISGTGAMMDFSSTGTPWFAVRASITSVVIESGVTHIGSYAFSYLQYVTSVSVPDTVQSFGSGAFRYCNKLTSINIPSGVTSIPDYCFGSCGLLSVDLPDGIVSIGALTFSLTCSVTYTASEVSQYKYGPRIYLCFYDEDGAYLSGHTGTDGKDIVAGTHTISKSYSSTFPAGAAYMAVVYGCGTFLSESAVSDISSYMELSVNYEPLVFPVDPVVTSNFASSYSYLVGQMPSELSVGASITDEGALSYQWYINTTNSTSGGTAIDGATSSSFSPPPSAEGTYYYYCAVTNTLGNSTATTYSDVTQLTFTKPVAARPTVNSNYDSYYSYYTGDTAAALSVGVTVTDGGTVTYQWYQNTVDGSDGATPISGATSSSYTPPTIAAGTMYYYCVVTNTLGDSTSVVYSKIAEIEVIPSTYILQAGQYECKSSVMTGEYVALDAWPDSLTSVNLAFRSSGVAYSQLSYKYDLLTGKGYGIYFDDTMAYTYGSIDQTAGFLSDAYALIYLEADQEVPTAFYEWFVSCFTYVGADEEIPVYSTIVQIYDNSGMVLLTTYTISGNGIAPYSYGSVLVNGVQFVSSSGDAWTWSGAGDPFYGFSLSANSVSTWYMVGETFTIGGVAADNTLTLYVVDSDTSSIDQEYQDASLNWFERIWQLIVEFHDEAKAFYQRATSVNWEKFTSSVEQKVTGFLDIIDFSAIGDFFKDAYQGISTLFGLSDLLYGENSPFGWLLEE